ncbi:unnamed protein product [Symbiodinium pilosum]|uniref:Uncharacterized protein n=1 Tax=Symbiodinium pilosum TaxID=2952 RepID=A0A812P4Z4_SYMPI|nr:unnamed protein product [Symbiodinium pilosum]
MRSLSLDGIQGVRLGSCWRQTGCKRHLSSAGSMQKSNQATNLVRPRCATWAAQTARGLLDVGEFAHKTSRWRFCSAVMSFLWALILPLGKKAT